MKDGENIVKLLAKCGRIMADGQFSKYDLDYISKALKIMTDATNKTISKSINKKD